MASSSTEARKARLGAIVDQIVMEPKIIRVVGKNDNFEQNLRSHAAGRGAASQF